MLHDISFSLEKGLVHGILGPNGSGKTTLFDVIAGKLEPQEGQVLYKGKAITSQVVGYLETQPYFYSLITGREYLTLHQYKNPDFSIDKWNEIFRLPLDHLIETYSSGMKKKLAIMAMVCIDLPLLLFDEPFNNLDLESNQFLARLFRLLVEKDKIIFLSSHHLEVMITVTDRIQLLNRGKIVDSVEKENFDKWKAEYHLSNIENSVNLASKLL